MLSDALIKAGVTFDNDIKSISIFWSIVLIVQGDVDMINELLKDIMARFY